MTREEATAYWKQRSKHIHNWLEENEDVDFIGEYVEAIDMAIEALQTDGIICPQCGKVFGEPYQKIVRCKDCKWYENRHDACHNPRYGDGHANYQPPYVDEDYWCKDGERKGGEDE